VQAVGSDAKNGRLIFLQKRHAFLNKAQRK